jgi:hypothetical protein
MPSWLIELIDKHWGFGAALTYATATYMVFHWLDKKASRPAKKALTARLQSQPPTKETLANFALEVFDRIYSKPLGHWRALCRSALITTALSVVIWIESETFEYDVWNYEKSMKLFIGFSLAVNIFADYVSLFFIKKLLTAAGRKPALGLIASFIVGSIVVYVTYALREILFLFFVSGGVASLTELLSDMSDFLFNVEVIISWSWWTVSLPAFAVHLWLPLFALAIALTQLLGWFFKVVGWMQWFIKQGRNHPFEAVGLVASGIVFTVGMIAHYAWR